MSEQRTRAEALFREVRRCTRCEDLPLGPRPLFQADPAARILLAGQAPGRVTHARGRPFDDVSGDRLRAWLGVDRDIFYDPRCFALVPMGFCYPGTGRGGDLPPRPACAAAWRSPILAQLPAVELTLLLGRYALAWHLPSEARRPLTQVVRRWREFWPALLPLPHPSPRNQRWLRANPYFEAEILPAVRERVGALLRGGGAKS